MDTGPCSTRRSSPSAIVVTPRLCFESVTPGPNAAIRNTAPTQTSGRLGTVQVRTACEPGAVVNGVVADCLATLDNLLPQLLGHLLYCNLIVAHLWYLRV